MKRNPICCYLKLKQTTKDILLQAHVSTFKIIYMLLVGELAKTTFKKSVRNKNKWPPQAPK